jgi:hypothetical protein
MSDPHYESSAPSHAVPEVAHDLAWWHTLFAKDSGEGLSEFMKDHLPAYGVGGA